jgi:glucose/arabinose dehydrogenase
VIRNVLLSALVVAAVLVGGFFVLRNQTTIFAPPQPAVKIPADTAQNTPPPKEATPLPRDTSPTPPQPPPPEETKTEQPKAVDTKTVAPHREAKRSEAAVPAESDFQVTTTPPGATVIFDDNPSKGCKSPCTVTLSAGRHTFVVQRAGYREQHRIIEVPRDAGLIVDMSKQTGSLSLITHPAGLTVYVDGKEQAQKTPANLTLSVGSHHVQVMKGDEKQEFTVDIRDGLLSSKFIEWNQ